MTEDNRPLDDAGEPMMTFSGMPGSSNTSSSSSDTEGSQESKKDLCLDFPEMRKTEAEKQAEEATIISDPAAASIEKFGEQPLQEMDQILQHFCDEDTLADLETTGLGNDPVFIGELLKVRPRLERLYEQYAGLDLNHPSQRNNKLAFNGDARELISHALFNARNAAAKAYGSVPGRFAKDFI